MMSQAAEVVVAPGTKHWRAELARKIAVLKPAVSALVVVYRRREGRVGFDLDKSGEEIFRAIIGDALSCSTAGLVRFSIGSPTQYVRGLFTTGKQQPITVSTVRSPSIDVTKALHLVQELELVDVDQERARFAAGIGKLAKSFDRVCVHSIAQWETTIATTRASDAMTLLKSACEKVGVELRVVNGEEDLPAW